MERKELQAKLEQNKKDQRSTQEKLQEEQRKIEKQIEALEVTYSHGDRFRGISGDKYMIALGNKGAICLLRLKSGIAWAGICHPKEASRITWSELGEICKPENLTRYWDNRKGKTV